MPQENLKAGQNQVLDRPGQVLGAPGSQLLKVKKTFFPQTCFQVSTAANTKIVHRM